MKILFINDNPLFRKGQDYYSIFTWPQTILKIAQLAESSTLWCPIKYVKSDFDLSQKYFKIDIGSTSIVENEYYDSFYNYYKMYIKNKAKIDKIAEQLIVKHDVIIVRTPSPIASLVAKKCLAAVKPLVINNVSDMKKQSTNLIKNKGLKRFYFFIMMNLFVVQENWQASKAALVTTYSKDVQKRLLRYNKNVKLMMMPHLSDQDLFEIQDTCQQNEIRIVRVSWLLPAKGIEYLLHAIAIILQSGYKVKLEIVGEEMYEGYQQHLEEICGQLGIRNYVTFTGWVKFDQLMSVYRRNDIQVVSSLAEGMPRCIVEGAANSLPLVSTKVGGIPDVLQDEVHALLVSPNDANSLANAIIRIIEDKELRRTLIRNGFEFAKHQTIESMSKTIINEISVLINS